MLSLYASAHTNNRHSKSPLSVLPRPHSFLGPPNQKHVPYPQPRLLVSCSPLVLSSLLLTLFPYISQNPVPSIHPESVTVNITDPIAQTHRTKKTNHIIMAEATPEQQPDLAPSSPTQKRKRGTESASPDARRSKRGTSAGEVAHPIEAAATAFMEPTGDQGLTTSSEFAPIPTTAGTSSNHSLGSIASPNAPEHAEAAAAAAATAANAATAAAALGSMFPHLNVPTSTEESFANQQIGDDQQHQQQHHADTSAYSAAELQQHDLSVDVSGGSPSNGLMKRPMTGIQVKPAVGSEEWHKMRKDNHKEVERRRRETINEGINELAKIVPGCEKNKGSILQRAVVFITQLKENETQNIEKWTLEKLLTEQAIAELSASNDKLKSEVERVYTELETWKRVAQNAGLQPEEKTEASS
ncbi:helix-loop-helix dna binding protein [Ophiostoma piceae UAMH 11346]|uniref:Helix-loop-helix dna binding protein n=1 Tax=Ophiostoma piceae (strain UAMH 11346) TaxID=1262450 RepID=S3CBR1_OPHP1|nr:helix-loop-helix dna binding protein [Ophiostoma piceae UAMH 11346]